jgi:glycogen operon protein
MMSASTAAIFPDRRDSAAIAPKSQVVDLYYDWQNDAPPGTPWGQTVIYEAHVKGLTYLHPDCRRDSRHL